MRKCRYYIYSRVFLLSALSVFLTLATVYAVQAADYKIAALDAPESRAVAKLVQAAYAYIGHRATVDYFPAERSLYMANTGEYDGELGRIVGIEAGYPNLIGVEGPIFQLRLSAVVTKSSDITEIDWGVLPKKSFAYQRGVHILKNRLQKIPDVTATSGSSIVKMLIAGRVDVGLFVDSQAETFVRGHSNLKILDVSVKNGSLFHYIHKRNRTLATDLGKALVVLKKSRSAK